MIMIKEDALPHRTFYLVMEKDVSEISQKETYKMWIKKRYMVLKDYNRVNTPYLERISEGLPQDVMFDGGSPDI